MTETIAQTLTALARIDSGELRLPLDTSLYDPELLQRVLVRFPHVQARSNDERGRSVLLLVAPDASTARIDLGHVLNEIIGAAAHRVR